MLDDPIVVALLGRAGGSVSLSAAELAAASSMQVNGTRNPATGEIVLALVDKR